MELDLTDELLARVAGQVFVVTGGAQGIGAAIVAMACRAGAHVFFGDWDEAQGRLLEANLAKGGSGHGSATFLRVDVRDYASQLALFHAAVAAHGRIDAAVPCAAGGEPPNSFEAAALTVEKVQTEPAGLRERLELNLLSVVWFSRIALAYMGAAAAPPPTATRLPSPVLILLSSQAGLVEGDGVPLYRASKHAIIGLLRSLAPVTPQQRGVRVNAICPNVTDTRMVDSLLAGWRAADLPLNTPDEVARMVLLCAADPALNGAAIYVSGGRGFDTEVGYRRTMPQWLGQANTDDYFRCRAFTGKGDMWVQNDNSWKENH